MVLVLFHIANQDTQKGGHSQTLIWVRPTSKHTVTNSLLLYDPHHTQLMNYSRATHCYETPQMHMNTHYTLLCAIWG